MGEVLIGIFLSVFIIIVVIFAATRKRNNQHFDEMQELARLRGYKYGFITALALLAIWMMLDTLDVLHTPGYKLYTGTLIMIVIFTSIMVAIVYDIVHDAYFFVGMKPDYWKKYSLLAVAIGVVNLVSAAVAMSHGPMVSNDGYLIMGGAISNIIVGAEFLLIGMLIIFFKYLAGKNAEE